MAKKKSKFKGKTTSNAHKQKSQGSQYGHLRLPRGVNVFKEEPGGRVKMDILPYVVTDPHHPDRDDELEVAVVGEQWYKRPYKLHRNIGVNNDSYVCPTSIGKKCPICEYRASRLKEGADYQDQEIKDMRPSARNLYVVVPLEQKNYDEKPHIWDIAQFLFQEMLNDELEEDEARRVFPDLEEGMTLRIRFSEEKFGKNPFAKTSRIDFDEREGQYDESMLEKIPNLDEVLIIPTYQQLEAAFFELDDEPKPEQGIEEGGKDEPEPREEPEEKPTRKKKDTKPKEDKPSEAKPAVKEEQEASDDDCVACEGTGVNSKGNPCRICKGTGKKQVEETEPEPEPAKQEQKSKPEPKPNSSKEKSSGPECPYGYTFGKDCEEHDECDECDLWDDCMDAKEEMDS